MFKFCNHKLASVCAALALCCFAAAGTSPRAVGAQNVWNGQNGAEVIGEVATPPERPYVGERRFGAYQRPCQPVAGPLPVYDLGGVASIGLWSGGFGYGSYGYGGFGYGGLGYGAFPFVGWRGWGFTPGWGAYFNPYGSATPSLYGWRPGWVPGYGPGGGGYRWGGLGYGYGNRPYYGAGFYGGRYGPYAGSPPGTYPGFDYGIGAGYAPGYREGIADGLGLTQPDYPAAATQNGQPPQPPDAAPPTGPGAGGRPASGGVDN